MSFSGFFKSKSSRQSSKSSERTQTQTSNTDSKDSSAPPPYAQPSQNTTNAASSIIASELEPEPPAFTRLGIKAHDVPQFLWSNAECRAWIYAFCVEMLGLTPEEAITNALKFEAAGSGIYGFKWDAWKHVVGKSGGGSIFNFIFAKRNEKGGLPKNITFDHFKPRLVEPAKAK